MYSFIYGDYEDQNSIKQLNNEHRFRNEAVSNFQVDKVPYSQNNLYRGDTATKAMNISLVTKLLLREVLLHTTDPTLKTELNSSVFKEFSRVGKINPDIENVSLALSKFLRGIVIKASQLNSSIQHKNEEHEEINHFYFYETEQFTVLWILFFVIVFGNTAVLVTLFISKSRKSRMNFFIRHLAIADLSVGLLNVLTDIIWRMTVTWEAGNLACKFIKFIQCMVTFASTYVLVALSIDRYDAITHPMNFSGSWKRAKILVISAWFVSALFSTPQFLLYEETLIQDRTQCWIELGEPWRWQLYMSLVSIVLFFIPALIISLCYAIIVKTIWEKGTYMAPKDKRKNLRNNANGDNDSDEDRGSRRASSRGIIPRAKVKTVKMTFVIVIVFIACWSPYIVFDLLQVFDQIPKTQSSIAIASFIQSLAPLNSAANPLIYCLFSTQVLKTLRRTSLCRWCSNFCCCVKKEIPKSQFANGRLRGGVNRNIHQNYDSMRTTTTSLTVTTSRHSTCVRPNRVVILERKKSFLCEQDEVAVQ